jgi:pimeloyl-ACP methyl ester carboxylesterase
MKALVLASAMLLAACQPEREAMNDPSSTAEAAAKPAQATTQDTKPVATSKDGTRIAFEKSGSGPALVLVSGALSQRSLYRDQPLVPTLAKHFTVYIYDRRGRGESTDVQPYAVAREIEDLDAVIGQAGGSAYVFGISSGAALSLQAAASLGPAKITKLAVYDTPYGQGREEAAKQKQRVEEVIRTGAPGEAAATFLSGIGTPPQALEEMKRSPAWETFKKIDFTLAYDLQILGDGTVPEILKTIQVPTLVMNGGASLKFMNASADEIAAGIPRSQRKTLEGQTHQLEADAVVPVLAEFFNGSSATK